MGSQSLQKIQSTLEQKYKPIRKYYNNFYGQITVLRSVQNSCLFAKVQKIMMPDRSTIEYIQRRLTSSLSLQPSITSTNINNHTHNNNNNVSLAGVRNSSTSNSSSNNINNNNNTINTNLLVGIKQVYRYQIDLCSGNQMCKFILEYHQSTLSDQIIKRNQFNLRFSQLQLLQLWLEMTQAVILIRKLEMEREQGVVLGIKNMNMNSNNSNNSSSSSSNGKGLLISNSGFVYCSQNNHSNQNQSKIKVIESIFCDKKQSQYQQNIQIRTLGSDNQQQNSFYISPQSFQLLCRKQKLQAKQCSITQPSLIFTMAMNFLQCALLSDLSELYNTQQQQFQHKKLQEFYLGLQFVEHYDDSLQVLLLRMLDGDAGKRPGLRDIEKYLKYLVEQTNYGKMRVSEIFVEKGMEKSNERMSGQAITAKKKNKNVRD